MGPESLRERVVERLNARACYQCAGIRSGEEMTDPNQPIATAQMLIRRPARVAIEAFVDTAVTSRSGSAGAAADWKSANRCDGIGRCTVSAQRSTWKAFE
jgi:hypothetical protein